jgi:hypothetical protein
VPFAPRQWLAPLAVCLRELILGIAAIVALDSRVAVEARLMSVMMDELEAAQPRDVHFGVSFKSLLVGGVLAVTAEPPLSVRT